MNPNAPASPPASPARRRVLAGAAALAALPSLSSPPAAAALPELPEIPELTAFLAGRTPRIERLVLTLPRLADDGNAVPARISMPGPFAPGAAVRTVVLYSERNPVHTIVMIDYLQPAARVELETRIRLAGTQRLVAVAALADNTVYAAIAEVEVSASACLDGT
jgi:sulfur-oxidizing protein SoxY